MAKQKLSELDKLRAQIDRVDREILEALNRRLRLVQQVGSLKDRTGIPCYDPVRETAILKQLSNINRGPISDATIRLIFSELFSASRNLERPLRVAYLGPEGTFTEQAALNQFGSATDYIPVSTIADVFQAVENGSAEYGVVPVENSSEGAVVNTLDAMLHTDLVIVAEQYVRVKLALMSRSSSLAGVKHVYSHPHGLGQARGWLKRNLPNARLHEMTSTAQAARAVRGLKYAAAVAQALVAKRHGLNILADGIESSRENLTRFLVLGTAVSRPSGNDKTAVAFSLNDRVGALDRVLRKFSSNKINLTRIQSRPSKRKGFDYAFFVDLEGHIETERVRRALRQLRSECQELRVFGSFPNTAPRPKRA